MERPESVDVSNVYTGLGITDVKRRRRPGRGARECLRAGQTRRDEKGPKDSSASALANALFECFPADDEEQSTSCQEILPISPRPSRRTGRKSG